MKTISRYYLLIVSFLLINQQIYSQNTGPVAPEAMSFEPVDAANMVNLSTGDFVYSLPILNIPGPGGGYPIALSYHGGVGIDQESSWVGLGWNINPGAISRGVLGYPDDMKDANSTTIIYNAGDTYTRRSVGTGFSYNGINFGNSLTWNSNWSQYTFTNFVGFGVSEMSVNVGLTVGTDFGVSAGVGQIGGIMSASVSAGTMGVGVSVGLGPASIDYNLISGEYSVGLSRNFYMQKNKGAGNLTGINFGLGASLSSDGNISAGGSMGASSLSLLPASSSTIDNMYTSHSSWYFSMLFINLGYDSYRYWYFDRQSAKINGMLYLADSYQLSDDWRVPEVQNENFVSDVLVMPYSYSEKYDNTTSETYANLMLPGYDQYVVNAQGLNGSMSLKYYEPSLLVGQTKVLDDFDNSEPNNSYDNIKREVNYHVLAGFSSRDDATSTIPDDELMRQMDASILPYFYFENSPTSSIQISSLDFTNEGSSKDPIWGEYLLNTVDGSELKSTTGTVKNNRKADGNFVQYFTNDEIVNNFDLCVSKGFLETSSITNTDTRNNSAYFTKDGIGGFSITTNDGVTYHYSLPVYQFEDLKINNHYGSSDFYLNIQEGYYAYTWLLTAITGPDYIDKGTEGYVDDADEGYWVKFEYGKWTDAYFWRFPFEGAENEELGRKQIYYLNKVETKTHEALFIKSAREDGIGIELQKEYTGVTGAGKVYNPEGYEDGFSKNVYVRKNTGRRLGYNQKFYRYYSYETADQVYYMDIKQVAPLQLDKILLIDKRESHTLAPDNSNWGNSEVSSIEKSIIYKNVVRVTNSNFLKDELPASIEDYELPTYLCQSGRYNRDCTQSIGNITQPSDKQNFVSYYDQNVLDLNDYNSLSEKPTIVKEIDFTYDSENALCKNAPNAPNGKLTLSDVTIRSNSGKSLLPPYHIEYYLHDNNYSKSDADSWGFHKDYPDNWSLKSISTPTGATLEVKYGSDSYHTESIFNGIRSEEEIEPINITLETFENEIGTFICELPSGLTYEDLFDMQIKYYTEGTYRILKILQLDNNVSETYSFNLEEHYTILPGESSNKFRIRVKADNSMVYEEEFYDYSMELVNFKITGLNKLEEELGGGCRVEEVVVKSPSKTIRTLYGYNNPITNKTSGVTSYAPGHEKVYIPLTTEVPSPCVYYEYVTVSSFDAKTEYRFEVPATSENTFAHDFEMGDQLKIVNHQHSVDAENPFVDISNGNHTKRALARSATIEDKTSRIGRMLSIKSYNNFDDPISQKYFKYYEDLNLGINQESYYYLKNIINWGSGHTASDQTFFFVSTTLNKEPSILKSTHETNGQITSSTFFSDLDPLTGAALSTISLIHDQNPGSIENVSDIHQPIHRYQSEVLPAHQIETYSGVEDGGLADAGMGSKVINPYNKNMLTQTAASMKYKKVDGSDKVLGVSINTWNNDWDDTYLEWNTSNGGAYEYNGDDPANANIWRKHKTFAWNGVLNEDGTFGNDFNSYTNLEVLRDNWDTYFGGSGYDKWIKTSEITRYDHYSTPIEVMDLNGDFAATRKDPENTMTIATAANASLAGFTASSFEYAVQPPGSSTLLDYGGAVIGNNSETERIKTDGPPYGYSGNTIDDIQSHTGAYFLKVNSGKSASFKSTASSSNLQGGQKFMASVWKHAESPGEGEIKVYVNGTQQTLNLSLEEQYGDWILMNYDFDMPSSVSNFEARLVASGGAVYFDDFRISPFKAAVSSYTYDKAGNVTAILDAQNYATRYYYDVAGRLAKTERETDKGFEKVSAHSYNYASRISVSPTEPQEYGYMEQDDIRFEVSQYDVYYDVSIPSWMKDVERRQGYFLVDVKRNTTCDERTGQIVINSTTTGETFRIDVSQAKPPKFSNLNILNSDGTELDDNKLVVGETYKFNFNYCDGMEDVYLNIYQYSGDNPSSTSPRISLMQVLVGVIGGGGSEGTIPYMNWTVPEYPETNSPGIEWKPFGEYRIHIEDDQGTVFWVSDIIKFTD